MKFIKCINKVNAAFLGECTCSVSELGDGVLERKK